MSLVPKTKKEEGKKHKTKKKIQKKQQIFKIKLRKDRFWMFGSHSKPISAVPAWFKADFGCFGQFRLPANTIRFGQTGPVRRESVKKKKKKIRCGTYARVGRGCGAHFAVSMHHSLWYNHDNLFVSDLFCFFKIIFRHVIKLLWVQRST